MHETCERSSQVQRYQTLSAGCYLPTWVGTCVLCVHAHHIPRVLMKALRALDFAQHLTSFILSVLLASLSSNVCCLLSSRPAVISGVCLGTAGVLSSSQLLRVPGCHGQAATASINSACFTCNIMDTVVHTMWSSSSHAVHADLQSVLSVYRCGDCDSAGWCWRSCACTHACSAWGHPNFLVWWAAKVGMA
jgi:hypothetical protein